MIQTVRTHRLLDSHDLEALLHCTAAAELRGLPPDLDSPELMRLHELLDENWLGERVLDACTHQITLEVQSSGPDRSESNHLPPLILPSIFNVQLTNAYNEKRLSKTLKDLRESLLADLPAYIAFAFNKRGMHWAACVVSTQNFVVYQGDSLGWVADETMLAKLQWFLADVTDMQGRWTEKALPVPNQGRDTVSCGIFVINAIHAFIDPSVPLWRQEDAATHRHNWLRKLLLFHLASIRALDVVSSYPMIEIRVV